MDLLFQFSKIYDIFKKRIIFLYRWEEEKNLSEQAKYNGNVIFKNKKLNSNILKLLFVIFIVQILVPEKAYAYLDPGTGSMIMQIIVASIAGLSCAIAVWKDRIIQFFKKGFKK